MDASRSFSQKFWLQDGESAHRLLIQAWRRSLVVALRTPEGASSCLTASVFPSVKWDHNPDLSELLGRLKEAFIVCEVLAHKSHSPSTSSLVGHPPSLPKWANPDDFVNLESFQRV